ncbi:MAG: MerR family transcriptional regulator [Clostridiales bacterium]
MGVKILIGEMARLHSISTQTLRYYDSTDLFKPMYIDENTGYRSYGIEQFAHLESILFLKGMGMSLKSIKEYFQNRDINSMALLLKQRNSAIDKEIKSLKVKKKKIASLIKIVDSSLGKGHLDTFRIKELPNRGMLFFRFGAGELVYEHELGIKKLGMLLNDIDELFLNPFSSVVDKSDIDIGNYSNFKGISLIVDEGSIDNDAVIPLEDGLYACITFIGTYKNVSTYFKKLHEWIINKNYEIIGDGLILIITDKAFTDYEYEYISEIQVPIKKLEKKS